MLLANSQEASEGDYSHRDAHPLVLAQTEEEVSRVNSDAFNKEATYAVRSYVERKSLTRMKSSAEKN